MGDIEQLFESVACTGALCVQDAADKQEVGLSADTPMVAASVIKLLIAVEAERRFADGTIDPLTRMRMSAEQRTPGPVGFSLYADDVELSARDLVTAMLTLSDNVATDAVLDLVGVDACNHVAAELGLRTTLLTGSMRDTVDSIGQAAGFANWQALVDASSRASAAELENIDAAVRSSVPLTAETATRTSARDMCLLLRAIWSDQAAPADSCARIRRLMHQQLTRDRLAAAFPPPARVAAKSGGLAGLVRNEVGVIEYPDGRRYFAAVFTRRTSDTATPAEINAAIGRAAAMAVDQLMSG